MTKCDTCGKPAHDGACISHVEESGMLYTNVVAAILGTNKRKCKTAKTNTVAMYRDGEIVGD